MQTSLQRRSMPTLKSSPRFAERARSFASAGDSGAPNRGIRPVVRRDLRTCFQASGPADAQDEATYPHPTPPVHQAQDPEHLQQQQQHLHPPNPFPLKYAQMGHSRFGRGAPHVCYSQGGDSGVFYIKPEVDELLGDCKQWLQQQQRQHQQHWQQQRQQLQAWGRAQHSGSRQVPLAGWGFRSTDAAVNPAVPNHHDAANATAAKSSSNGRTSASNAAAADGAADKQSLLDSMLSSTAAGGIGVIAALAAAVVAAFNIGNSSGSGGSSSSSSGGGDAGRLHAAGPGPLARVQHMLLGMFFGVVGFVLIMQYCKAVLAALLLCYAGFALGM